MPRERIKITLNLLVKKYIDNKKKTLHGIFGSFQLARHHQLSNANFDAKSSVIVTTSVNRNNLKDILHGYSMSFNAYNYY